MEMENTESVHVLSGCQTIFRIIDPDASEGELKKRESAVFHVPPFPSLNAIDPSEKLYKKRDELDADLVELMLCIDWKVNFLIKMLSPKQDSDIYPYRALILEMSTESIKIITDQDLSIGAFLEFHFTLPILPFKELFLRGKLLNRSDQGEYVVEIDLDRLQESDREHLIGYLVKRQFQLKREQTRNR